jgi:N,N'-diacetylbacillosaminyl-diphospho-undecaprenol alpha-1,3-N-acetylgalactosaminyltransferase
MLGAHLVKVAVICPDAFTAWQFHRKLLLALIGRNHRVYVISPPVRADDVRRLRSLGVVHIPIRFDRFISPRSDLLFMARLYAILRAYRFDCVHSFNLKCHIYGSCIAALARVPKVLGTIEGLGFAYTEPTGIRATLLMRLVDSLSAFACRLADKVWFVNSDDLELFAARHIIPRHKAVLVNGCGVDVSEFSDGSINARALDQVRAELDLDSSTVIVTMAVARAVWSKGVHEFVEAATRLASMVPDARFVLLAPREEHSPQAVPAQYLRDAERSNANFRWLSTFRADVREILALSDIFVLPSYYREGVPKVLMEAMAMGKPIVTTDNVGCRDVVDEGQNGLLVPVRDSAALARALATLLMDGELRLRFGQHSREKVVREFADTVVVARVLKELYATR